MASTNSFVLAEEELYCPICFEEFSLYDVNRHPKLLLCLHTFCSECMETLRKYDGTLQCSICRTSHSVYRIRDLMDNYVIFEHLKIKQETEDEKLAKQLCEEYDASLKILQEQEERDAAIAREEEKQSREELEKKKREEEEQKKEEEKQKQGESGSEEAEAIDVDDGGKRSSGDSTVVISSDDDEVSDDTYSIHESSDDSDSSEDSEDSGETSDNEEENPFHDVEESHSEDERGVDGRNVHATSNSSITSRDDYATLGNESDNVSPPEDEIGSVPPSDITFVLDHSSNSDDNPNLLSDEFSGVAQSSNKAGEKMFVRQCVVTKSKDNSGEKTLDDSSNDDALFNLDSSQTSENSSNSNGYETCIRSPYRVSVKHRTSRQNDAGDDAGWIESDGFSDSETAAYRNFSAQGLVRGQDEENCQIQ